VEIKAWGEHAQEAIDEAFHEMERVNTLLNNYSPDSEVSKINEHAGGDFVQISPETMEVLQLGIQFGDISGGAFDFTIGPLLKLWGFAQEKAGLEGKDPDAQALKKARWLVDDQSLELHEVQQGNRVIRTARLQKSGMWIDVGAISKGYIADRAIEVLKKRGIQNVLIAAGGTICALGVKPDKSPWKIGIRHPRKKNSYLTILSLVNKTVSTSGDYERFYKKNGKMRTHIIDPRTGLPVEHMQSVTVIAQEGVESDALSTALFVLGSDEGIRLVNKIPNVEALIISQDGQIVFSHGWPQKTIVY
jgi:thiamine biosynthesis lipoprotein